MRTRIVTDSTAELSPSVAAALDIVVVPQLIQIGAESVPDDMQPRSLEFVKRLQRTREPVSVVPPGARDMADLYARLSRDADAIVSIHAAGGLNGIVQAANLARRNILGHCQISVIDSGLISHALGVLVTEAANAALSGAEGTEVVRLVRGVMPRIYLAFYAENLDQLRRGGFLPPRRVATEGGAAFKPLFLVEDGHITKLHRTRSRGTPVERLGEFVAEFTALKELTILYSGIGPKPEPLEALLAELLPNQHVDKHMYGPSFAAYVGQQVLGIVAHES
ncbi:MAG: DegV family EDD domain-containing protein [Chloroflexi bacterium]|nr:DegV family EDD domain-containing protein [Chloroflexota bacterium]